MMVSLDFWFAIAYAAVSLAFIFRAQRFQWLWAAVLLWLGISALGARLLPGMWGFTHTGPLFIPHFYLTAASVFFFIDDCGKTEDGKFWSAGEYTGLTLFAVSNVVMTLAFVFLAVAVYFILPLAGSVFAWAALLKIYALKPIYWFALQGVLMLVFYLHRVVVCKQSASLFSMRQMWAGWTVAVVMQAVVAVALIFERSGY
ncbi:MAG: hypothetical protein HXM89_04660 [Neisseria sp.]|mgnify:FL=1|uniref:hypothetical protein n=1 Tax=unclassified Neisseria TaxID=2623750 RepID=UPI0008A465EE|nr:MULTISPECIES: hypothetical protein [unclassified Neisseria]MBF1270692.1 hypothetical protein [Neisseria sp.]OFR81317.1 hypothetical protein HMPREF2865_02685 [Neisseria sp. HMSC073G10]OHR13550.1 hypothetical protein HMPREF2596_01785 [Neisseria sp. HMSC078C12]